MLSWSTFRSELRPTLHLALPLVLAEIGWISMAIVDTMTVGRLPNSAQAIAAVSISSGLYLVFVFFGEGLLIGLDTLVSQSFGAGRRDDCYHSLVNGVYLSFALAPFLLVPAFLLPRFFADFGVAPDIAVLATPYMHTLTISLIPLLLYFTQIGRGDCRILASLAPASPPRSRARILPLCSSHSCSVMTRVIVPAFAMPPSRLTLPASVG